MRPSLTDSLARLHLPVRLASFELLEWVAALRTGDGKRAAPLDAVPPAAGEGRSLWVFVSTIGELNAIEPFLSQLHAALGQPPMLLISDRRHYSDAFRSKYPQAGQACLQGLAAETRQLARDFPPLMLLVAEIPCHLHDAPCRFSFAAVHAARRAGAPVVLVNGWLYGYAPPSRMDAIEHRLFAGDYLRTFDLMLVQTEAVRQTLVEAGAESESVVVTGNIKFDAMAAMPAASANSPLRVALGKRAHHGPVVVAGSVTETSDQQAILQAHASLRLKHPDALLVLAPRHPENLPRMSALIALLEASALPYRLRSQHPTDSAFDTSVLVLDTLGELRDCYAEASLAFVGKDHNVLEPMAFGKPVFVGPGWEPTYPSYPVYRQLLDAGALNSVDSLDELGPAWLGLLADTTMEGIRRRQIDGVLAQAAGATVRNLAAMRERPTLAALMRPTGE
jgi:3-deoxy-D-manno-octulosonic-acid transferase